MCEAVEKYAQEVAEEREKKAEKRGLLFLLDRKMKNLCESNS